ncbi:MAG: vitamin K epoxide reductase family protein [Myxococcota bacterium]|nr:vitamin K epoxide reductase family protein [Myxococcota bacterium]
MAPLPIETDVLPGVPSPEVLGRELRDGHSPDLTRRRWIVGLSLIGTAAAQLISLFQVGVLKRLPDPPLPKLDSSRVDASREAHRWLAMPDGPLMLGSYAATAALAASGGIDRARTAPIIPLAMAAKTTVDAALSIALARRSWTQLGAFCFYCQVSMVCSIASAVLAAPEARRAARSLRG